MEDSYQNKYENQSMVPDGLKFIACVLLLISFVFAFLFLPEYERGDERKLLHYAFSLSYLFTGIFVSAVVWALSFICDSLDTKARSSDVSKNNQ